MSLELVATLASIGTLLVIAATAVAAFVQLRHLSGSNSISALTESREVLESAEFAAAQRFVAYELPELLKDPAVRHELVTASPLSERLRAITVVGNFFESLGTFVRHGVIDREIATSLWAGLVLRSWERLSPALAILRRVYGPAFVGPVRVSRTDITRLARPPRARSVSARRGAHAAAGRVAGSRPAQASCIAPAQRTTIAAGLPAAPYTYSACGANPSDPELVIANGVTAWSSTSNATSNVPAELTETYASLLVST
jgi:hypothetical protein